MSLPPKCVLTAFMLPLTFHLLLRAQTFNHCKVAISEWASCRDCALHRLRVGRSLYGSDESSARPDGARHSRYRSVRRRPGRQSKSIGLSFGSLCLLVSGEDRFFASLIPVLAGRGRPSLLRPMAAGTLVPATACSSSCSGAQETRKALTLTGSPCISRRASTGAICSRPSRPCWREGSHCQADLARIMTTVVQIGPTILRKSFMSIISATP